MYFSKEKILDNIPVGALLDIDVILSIEYPLEANALIIVMNSGSKYRLTIEKEEKKEDK